MMDWKRCLAGWNWKRLGFCFILALIQGIFFLGVQMVFTEAISFPLDDSYIHMQYARQIAGGSYFQYQDGEPVSAGATSFLYVHLLAIGYLIGFRGSLFHFWAMGIALISITIVFYGLIRLGEILHRTFAGKATLALTVSSGVLAWGMWSGMEIALFAALLLIVLQLALSPVPNFPRLLFFCGWLTLCRPEGTIVVIVILSILSFQSIVNRTQWHRRISLDFCISFLFFLSALLIPSLYFRFVTGNWGGNGLLSKSLLHNPVMSGWEMSWEFLQNFKEIVLFLLGRFDASSSEFVFPGLFFFSSIGVIGLAFSNNRPGIWQLLLLGGSLLAAMTAIATLEVWPLHNYRYLLPFFPLFFLLCALGIDSLCLWCSRKDFVLRNAVLLCAITMGVIHFPGWVNRYTENASTIYEKQRRTAHWIERNLPGESKIAINDAGVLTYFKNPLPEKNRIVDLVGLVTNGSTIPYRMGEGGLYEWMKRLPDEQRPHYAAVFPSWFKEMSQVYDIFYQPLVSFPDPFDPGFGKTVFKVNWSYAGMEDNPRSTVLKEGWSVRDCLNVADLESEKSHQYVLKNRNPHYPQIPVPYRRNFGYHEEIEAHWPDIENEQKELIPVLRNRGILNQYDIMDAGRRITGEESFVFQNLEPGKETYLFFRTCDGSGDYPQFEYNIDVYIQNHFVQTCKIQGTPWNWYDVVIELPIDLIEDKIINLRLINRGSVRFSYYDSFYYWIVQDDSSNRI